MPRKNHDSSRNDLGEWRNKNRFFGECFRLVRGKKFRHR